ncbi:MAG: energy-coupling factor ABC transporter permease [Eubacteriales bacterium]
MADALISPVVSGVMTAVSVGAVAYSAAKMKKEGTEIERIPVMGVMGAFVFAAQMINFTIPVTGSSGHIGGGVLLAAVLGGPAAFISITAVLIIQALFFADGGLLALGCNVFNMGVLPCLIAYPLLFRPLLRRKITAGRLYAVSVLTVLLALQAGAFSVVLQTLASGITELPFAAFTALMLPIHAAIGAIEGIVTASVLIFIWRAQPDMPDFNMGHDIKKGTGMSRRKVVVILAAAALVIGGGFSLVASSLPDGLEWAVNGVTGTEELTADGELHEAASVLQENAAFMPDYGFKNNGSAAGTSVAGIIGGLLTAGAAAGTGFVIYFIRRKKASSNG